MQIKRRQTVYRVSTDRRVDQTNLITRTIIDSKEHNLRESINPLEECRPFPLIVNNELPKECLEMLLKVIEKEVLVVGMILPHQLLTKCYSALTRQKNNTSILSQGLEAVILQDCLGQQHVLLLMLSQQSATSQLTPEFTVQLSDKLLLNLSFVVITTESFVRSRINFWGTREHTFDKTPSLVIVNESRSPIGEEALDHLESIFWTVEVVHPEELDRSQRHVQLGHKVRRQAYQGFNEEGEEVKQFEMSLRDTVKVSLKRNWKFSQNMLSYPFLYFVSFWVREEGRENRQIIDLAVNSFLVGTEEQFMRKVESYSLPMDELQLRDGITKQRRQLMMTARRHISMFEHVFSQIQLTSRAMDNLSRFVGDKEKDLYQNNNTQAIRHNQTLLRRLYEDVVNVQFTQNQNSERGIQAYQGDFEKLLELYGHKSIRVSSQLKTFNSFMAQTKDQYAQQLGRELRRGPKKYSSHEEQLKDRLEIQTGVLDTLEMELAEMEEKRQNIDAENSKLKNTITDYQQKRRQILVTELSSPSRESRFSKSTKYFGAVRKEKTKARINDKEQGGADKKCCGGCCCEVM